MVWMELAPFQNVTVAVAVVPVANVIAPSAPNGVDVGHVVSPMEHKSPTANPAVGTVTVEVTVEVDVRMVPNVVVANELVVTAMIGMTLR